MRARLLMSFVMTAVLLAVATPASAQGGGSTSLRDTLSEAWDRIRSPFHQDTVSAISRSTPIDVMHDFRSSSDLWEHLRDAGYELAEVTTGVGIIPDIKMQFRLMRELSTADREMLERKLEVDAAKNRSFSSLIGRQIVHALLDASELRDMRITKLDITLLPLPSAEFVMEPRELPLSEEHDAIMQALQYHSQNHAEEARTGSKTPKRAKAAEPTDILD